MLAQLLHRRIGIFRLPLLGRLVALPLDEAAADRIVFLLVKNLVAGHEAGRHGVGVREVALRRVVDDVGERQVERLAPQLHRVGLIRLGDHLVEEARIHGRRFLAHEACERCTLGAVALAGGTEAAEEVDLEAGGLGQLVRGQLLTALVEIVGDAHRSDGVRARGTRANLVELVRNRHDRSLRGLDDIKVGREGRAHLEAGIAARGCLLSLLCRSLRRGLLRAGLRRPRRAGHHRRRTDGGVAREECPTVDACRCVRNVRQGRKSLVLVTLCHARVLPLKAKYDRWHDRCRERPCSHPR